YYNGTEWVKSASGSLDQEWIHNGIDAIYAKKAKGNNPSNIFEILDNGKVYINQGGVDWTTLVNDSGQPTLSANPRGNNLNSVFQSSDILPLNTLGIDYNNSGGRGYVFNSLTSILKENHTTSSDGVSNLKSYTGSSYSLINNDLTSRILSQSAVFFSSSMGRSSTGRIDELRGVLAQASNNSSGHGYVISGVHSDASVGGEVGATARELRGVYGAGYQQYNASADIIKGGHFYGLSRWTSNPTEQIIGVYAEASNSKEKGLYPGQIEGTANVTNRMAGGVFLSTARANATYNSIFGTHTVNIVENDATVSTGMIASLNRNEIKNTTPHNFVFGGMFENVLAGTGVVTNLSGVVSRLLSQKVNQSVDAYMAFRSDLGSTGAINLQGSIDNYYDFYTSSAPTQAKNKYGFYIQGDNKINFLEGSLGVGTAAPTEKLEVAGNVKATGFIGANAAIFPDYVFQKYYTGTSSLKADYSFKTLSQVEDFVKTNGHLPGYKSAAEIKKQGYIDLMATQLTNVEKIEELYLHLLEKDKEVKALKAEITELKSLVKDLLAK
ncbi:hypothetical protein NNL19_09410, partial [Riemerella anatipestifer]|uniref:hypothetical protein n=1 Tax=Riemerella anatipestifer TaxID=34085 RepID=UPI00210ED0FF